MTSTSLSSLLLWNLVGTIAAGLDMLGSTDPGDRPEDDVYDEMESEVNLSIASGADFLFDQELFDAKLGELAGRYDMPHEVRFETILVPILFPSHSNPTTVYRIVRPKPTCPLRQAIAWSHPQELRYDSQPIQFRARHHHCPIGTIVPVPTRATGPLGGRTRDPITTCRMYCLCARPKGAGCIHS